MLSYLHLMLLKHGKSADLPVGFLPLAAALLLRPACSMSTFGKVQDGLTALSQLTLVTAAEP